MKLACLAPSVLMPECFCDSATSHSTVSPIWASQSLAKLEENITFQLWVFLFQCWVIKRHESWVIDESDSFSGMRYHLRSCSGHMDPLRFNSKWRDDQQWAEMQPCNIKFWCMSVMINKSRFGLLVTWDVQIMCRAAQQSMISVKNLRTLIDIRLPPSLFCL